MRAVPTHLLWILRLVNVVPMLARIHETTCLSKVQNGVGVPLPFSDIPLKKQITGGISPHLEAAERTKGS